LISEEFYFFFVIPGPLLVGYYGISLTVSPFFSVSRSGS